ncbi:hypothetical protein NE237_027391 [Protea cynaroides]|uniref:Uncharacterized protein n=1 Tax=Protea cynaroides TaxID=273540 RepID=A0A9Q0GRS1_9MAGN|nr:hypothetical protein NE237_027391 [Protea cynaroides]
MSSSSVLLAKKLMSLGKHIPPNSSCAIWGAIEIETGRSGAIEVEIGRFRAIEVVTGRSEVGEEVEVGTLGFADRTLEVGAGCELRGNKMEPILAGKQLF